VSSTATGGEPALQRGRVPAGGRHAAIGALLDAMPLLHWTPVTPDAAVADSELIAGSGGLRVNHAPWHTPRHIVLLHEPTRTLLAGDAVFHRRAEPSQGPDALSFDPAARDASLAKLPPDVAAVGFAHGPPLTGTQVEHYQSWLAAATRIPSPPGPAGEGQGLGSFRTSGGRRARR